MINYVEYLGIPTTIAVGIILIFFILQIVGELLEFKGKVAPEFMKIRKYFARKKEERKALGKMTTLLDEHEEMSETLVDVKRLLTEVDAHYNNDNIDMRNKWMNEVNEYIVVSKAKDKEQDSLLEKLNEKLDITNNNTLLLLIDNKRDAIINFASKVIDDSYPVTKEQFNRIFRIYQEYEQIIKENNMTNGEVDIAIRIVRESYENHMKHHTFIEDVRGYN